MTKDSKVHLEDILECIGQIEEYTDRISFSEFDEDIKTQDACLRRIEIIGEAVKNLPHEFRALHPDIPWKQFAGMRDVLIHEYAGVILERVWNTIKEDIPILKKYIQSIGYLAKRDDVPYATKAAHLLEEALELEEDLAWGALARQRMNSPISPL